MIGRIIFFIFLIIQPFIGNAITSKFFNSNLNSKNRTWYSKLKQSPLTPPPIVFPIVWSILYLLLGLSIINLQSEFIMATIFNFALRN